MFHCLGPKDVSQPAQHLCRALVRPVPNAREQADAVRVAYPAGRLPPPYPPVLKFSHHKHGFWVSQATRLHPVHLYIRGSFSEEYLMNEL